VDEEAMTDLARAPEARFVTQCVREPVGEQWDEIHSAATAVRDWDTVVATAAGHGVTAFVQQAVALGGLPVSPRTAGALRGVVNSTVARAMGLNLELQRVNAALAAAQLPVIVLKGPILARTVYPAAALRPYDDIDINVPDSDEQAVADVLVGCGFHEFSYHAEAALRAHAGHLQEGAVFHRIFVKDPGALTIELHTEPLQLGLKPTCEAARWRRALPAPHLPGALMLCPEDQLVQLSVHAHKHGFSRLIWLKDIDLLLRVYGPTLDWDLVAQVAAAEGVRSSVWYTLRLAQALLSAPVAPSVLRRLRPGPLLRTLYQLVWPTSRIVELRGKMRRRGVQLRLVETWRGTLPSLILMGRRGDRARALVRFVLPL
jgi:hypothetical protein